MQSSLRDAGDQIEVSKSPRHDSWSGSGVGKNEVTRANGSRKELSGNYRSHDIG